MQIDFDRAVEVFENAFDDTLKSSYLHPCYVSADAMRSEDLSPVFFVYTEGVCAFYYAFHLSPVPGQDLSDIQSPYGYGGPISNTHDRNFLERAWRDFYQWCKAHSVLAEFIRFHPLLENRRFYPGETILDREIVWVNLREPDLLSTYSTRARTAIRKAQNNGIKVEWWEPEDFGPMFRELYFNHMQTLNADGYYFFSEDYFHSLTSWKNAQLSVCTLNGEILAAAIFLQGSYLMEYHLSAATRQGKKLSATNLLIHEAALRGRNRGCSMLNLGGGTDASHENPLFFFKSGFSASRASFYIGKGVHLLERYQILKASWEEINHRSANNVLFYR